MAEKYTNTSRRVIHLPGGEMMVPGQPVELSPEILDNPLIQTYMENRDIEPGEVKLKSEVEEGEDPPAPPQPVKQPPVKPPAPPTKN